MEILVVVAILGMLAAVALPIYSTYQAKSKLMGALTEISTIKIGVQISLDQGADVNTPEEVGGSGVTENCSGVSVVAVATAGSASVRCTVANGPSSVQGQTITWTRDQTAGWICSTTAPSELAPRPCLAN